MLGACVEMLFKPEHPVFADRIRAAHAAGFARVEFWTWRDKDEAAVTAALRETGVGLSCILVDPKTAIVDPATHAGFLQAVRETAAVAQRLGAGGLIVVTGDTLPDRPHAAQRAAVVAALRAAAPLAVEAGLTLLLEPLNSRVDHAGYFLDLTPDGFSIVEEVDHPAVRLLYDHYHSTVMGEVTAEVLAGRGHLIGHVHLADAPGRHEPGTGTIDWPARLADIRAAGYRGPLGLEFRPTAQTRDAVLAVRRHLPTA